MDYKLVGEILNGAFRSHNFQVNPKTPAGKPGKNDKKAREFRLQLINKHADIPAGFVERAKQIIKQAFPDVMGIQFNQISPNSSKFPSYGFTLEGQLYDIVIARGANKGENFEVVTTQNLAQAFHTRSGTSDFHKLIHQLGEANHEFRDVEIIKVEQRKGSTKKTGVPIEKLGEIIGDIILTDQNGKKWFVSLKDVNGHTFSAFPGASTIFNLQGIIQPKSEGCRFLEAFGVDLAMVQAGFNERRGGPTTGVTKVTNVKQGNRSTLKTIFEQAWGMNYFYVRKKTSGWEVFWIDRHRLNGLAGNIRIESITYPSKKTKSIMIYASNSLKNYKVEIRNSAGGEYPNDIKFGLR